MYTREEIDSYIVGYHDLSLITQKIISWDFEALSGIGFYRKHDKYAHIEVTVTKVPAGLGRTCLEWAVPPELFPEYYKKRGYEQLKEHVSFIAKHVSALKGETVYLNFKVTNAGFSPVDDWARGACAGALLNAFASGFLPSQFESNKKEVKITLQIATK